MKNVHVAVVTMFLVGIGCDTAQVAVWDQSLTSAIALGAEPDQGPGPFQTCRATLLDGSDTFYDNAFGPRNQDDIVLPGENALLGRWKCVLRNSVTKIDIDRLKLQISNLERVNNITVPYDTLTLHITGGFIGGTVSATSEVISNDFDTFAVESVSNGIETLLPATEVTFNDIAPMVFTDTYTTTTIRVITLEAYGAMNREVAAQNNANRALATPPTDPNTIVEGTAVRLTWSDDGNTIITTAVTDLQGTITEQIIGALPLGNMEGGGNPDDIQFPRTKLQLWETPVTIFRANRVTFTNGPSFTHGITNSTGARRMLFTGDIDAEIGPAGKPSVVTKLSVRINTPVKFRIGKATTTKTDDIQIEINGVFLENTPNNPNIVVSGASNDMCSGNCTVIISFPDEQEIPTNGLSIRISAVVYNALSTTEITSYFWTNDTLGLQGGIETGTFGLHIIGSDNVDGGQAFSANIVSDQVSDVHKDILGTTCIKFHGCFSITTTSSFDFYNGYGLRGLSPKNPSPQQKIHFN